MNKRLSCIAAHVADGIGLIDVGTDHGYLPLALARRGYPGRLIASDINDGPLATARAAAEEAQLSERITFQLCDGLDGCEPSAIDTIVIAGMGGDTICGILDRAEWCMDPRYTLILQPMTRAEVLRYWLVNNGFTLTAEELVEDAGRLYAIVIARYGGESRLTDAELFTGSAALLEGQLLFARMLRQQTGRFEAMLKGLACSDDGADRARSALVQNILTQLKEMERHDDDGRDISVSV